MARPKANPQDVETRQRLLQAAEHIFAQNGYERARLEDIAKDAGISRPSLLYHFASKERLYEQVVRGVFNKLGELFLETIRGEGEFAQRLDRTIAEYVRFIDAHPAVAQIIVREILDAGAFSQRIIREEVVPLLDEIERVMHKESGEAWPEGMPTKNVITQVALTVMLRKASGPLAPYLFGVKDATREIVQMLLAGARSERGARAPTTHR
jgi:AcrR family transcriptional regulator